MRSRPRGGLGDERVAPHHHDALRVLIVRPTLHQRGRTYGDVLADKRRRVANVQVATDGVGTAQRIGNQVRHAACTGPRAAVAADGVHPVLLAHRGEPFGDTVERLVPCHPLPPALAPGSHALERVEHPVGMVEPSDLVFALGADIALVVGVIGVALQPHHAPILDVRKHAAFAVARLTDGTNDGHRTTPSSPGCSKLLSASPTYACRRLPRWSGL
jgi:hypothetical protein